MENIESTTSDDNSELLNSLREEIMERAKNIPVMSIGYSLGIIDSMAEKFYNQSKKSLKEVSDQEIKEAYLNARKGTRGI
jgi:hypothetical protein